MDGGRRISVADERSQSLRRLVHSCHHMTGGHALLPEVQELIKNSVSVVSIENNLSTQTGTSPQGSERTQREPVALRPAPQRAASSAAEKEGPIMERTWSSTRENKKMYGKKRGALGLSNEWGEIKN
jgi:hypothetical protein